MFPKIQKFNVLFIVSLFCLTLLGQGAVHVIATKGAYPGSNGMIAFVDWVEGGREEIFIMNSDGSGVMRLTYNETVDKDPC